MADANIKAVITAEDRASATLRNFGNNASSLGSKLAKGAKIAAVGMVAAGAAAIAFGVSCVKSFNESEKATAQLNAVLKSTKGVAGVSAKAAQDLATSLQKTTTYSDETTLSAESMLLTFTKIGKDIFPQATKTVLDMSTALGQDTKASAIQLGKALQDPIQGLTALKRVGVNFSSAQRDVIKNLVETGQSAKAQRLILKELSTEFGGSATAAANTFSGKLEILKNQFDDIKESVGKVIIDALSPLITKLSEFVASKEFQKWLTDSLDKLKKFIEDIDWDKLAQNIKSIADAVIAMAKAFVWAIQTINVWVNRFIAFGGRLLFEWQKYHAGLKRDWANLKSFVNPVAQSIANFIQKYIINPLSKIGGYIRTAQNKFAGLNPFIKAALNGIANTIMGPFKPAFSWILRMIAKIQGAINSLSSTGIGSVAKTVLSSTGIGSVAKTVAGWAAKASKKATGTDFFSPRKYAGGTSGAYGGMALVGERGPEMVTLPRGSKVTRADETRKMMGGSNNINITVPMLTGSANERRKVARMLIKDIQDIAGMNGQSVANMMSSNYGLVS